MLPLLCKRDMRTAPPGISRITPTAQYTTLCCASKLVGARHLSPAVAGRIACTAVGLCHRSITYR
jgi:hypothetical protein